MQVDNTVTGHNRTLRFTNIPGFDGVVVETTFTSPGGGDPARALDNVVIPFLVNQINRWPGAPKALDDMSVLDDLIAAYSDRCGTDTRGAIRDAITNLIRRAEAEGLDTDQIIEDAFAVHEEGKELELDG
jgi:hypothetical protein